MNKLKEKTNEEHVEELEGIISGDYSFERFQPHFQTWTILKTIFKEMGPLTYERHFESELSLENLKVNRIRSWK